MNAPLGLAQRLPSLTPVGAGPRDAPPLFGAPAPARGQAKSEPMPQPSQQLPLPAATAMLPFGRMPPNAPAQAGSSAGASEQEPGVKTAPSALTAASMTKARGEVAEPIPGLPMRSLAAHPGRSSHILQSVHFLQRVPHGVNLGAGCALNTSERKPGPKPEPVYPVNPMPESSVQAHTPAMLLPGDNSPSGGASVSTEQGNKPPGGVIDANKAGESKSSPSALVSQTHGNRNSLPHPTEQGPTHQPTAEPSREVFNAPRLYSMYPDTHGPLPRIVSNLPPSRPDAAPINMPFRNANQASNAMPAPAMLQPLYTPKTPHRPYDQTNEFMPPPAPYAGSASQPYRSSHKSESGEKSATLTAARSLLAGGPPTGSAPMPVGDALPGNNLPAAGNREGYRPSDIPPPQHPIGNPGFSVHQAPARQAVEMRDANGRIRGAAAADDSLLHRSSTADGLEASAMGPMESASVMYPGQTQNGPGEGPEERRGQLKVEHALAYLELVKTQFGDNIEVYNRFLDIMKAFKAQAIDTTEVIMRVSQLFSGHPTLILGFNRFLPSGYKIQVKKDEATGALRTGFEGPQGFSALPSLPAVVVNTSPRSHTTSQEQFNDANTDTGNNVVAPPVQADVDVMNVDNVNEQVKRRLDVDSPPRRPEARPAARANNVARISAQGNQEQDSAPDVDSSSPDEDVRDFEKVLRFVNAIKTRSTVSPDIFCRFKEILSQMELQDRGVSEMCDDMSELLENDSDLYERFKELVRLASDDETPMSKPVNTPSPGRLRAGAKRTTSTSSKLRGDGSPYGPNELAVFDDIKEQLGPANANIYGDFIKCISLLTAEILTKDDVVNVASDLFRDFPGALATFKDYLEAVGQEGGLGDGANSSSSLKDVDPETLAQFKVRPISEIAAESKVFGTKSYRRLPKSFPNMACSGRSKLEEMTLNDNWVSVTQGSEEYSAKFMRKNSYEDNLYRCEDDRYELDMVIETNAATIMTLEPIAHTMTELPTEIKPMHALVDGVLNRIHYNAIQRIYGEQGPEIVNQVKLNPSIAIPLVLARLKEKDVHWRRTREVMNRVWRDVGEKNYYRGIDHRSGVFKAFDKKEISSKMLLLDILDPETSEENRENEMARARGFTLPGGHGIVNDRSRAVLAVTANINKSFTQVPIPTLELTYKDSTLHRNVFELVKMVILKDFGDNTAARSVLRSLRKLVTTFFGASCDGDEEDAISAKEPSVLYGDESIYILLRLYDYVYERLALAKTEAMKLAASEREKAEMNKKGKARIGEKNDNPNIFTVPEDLVQNFTSTNAQKLFRVGKLKQDGQALYDEFLKIFKGLLLGREDVQKFEDRCRVIIGPMSFVLFTLDKLLGKLARQVNNVCSSESYSKTVLDLYQDSHARLKDDEQDSAKGMGRGSMEALYCSTVAAHLGKEKGDKANMFRMEFLKQGEEKVFAINVVGRTSSDELDASRNAENAKLDEFVEFKSAASEGGEMKKKKGNSQSAPSEEIRTVSRGLKRRGDKLCAPVWKRGKIFAGYRPVFRKRTLGSGDLMKGADVIVKNSLRAKLNKDGELVYKPGTSDVFMKLGKKWTRPSVEDVNAKSSAAKKVRSLLGIDAAGGGAVQEGRLAESTASSSD